MKEASVSNLFVDENMANEENTKEMDGAKPILERILARLDSMDERLKTLEEQNERRAIETKPMWERALTEIAETRQEMKDGFTKLERKFDLEMRVVHEDSRRARIEIEDLRDRIEQIEKSPS